MNQVLKIPTTHPDYAFGIRLAFALHETGKLSIREISKEIAKYGVVGRNGKPLLPGTLWRMLSRMLAAD
jgi:hypothetical protein